MSTTTIAPARIATTLTITSTSTPSLNGSYGIGPFESDGLQAQANAIAMDAAFADGTESLNWPDVNRVGHTFTVAQFKELLMAVALYRAQWVQFSCGLITTAPTSTATIA